MHNIEKSNVPEVATLSRRGFLQLTGMSLMGAALALQETQGEEVIAKAKPRGPVRMKMPPLPCCHPAYRGRGLKGGEYVVWGDPTGKGVQAFRLNACGGAIMLLCDGSRSVEEITEAIAVKHRVPKEEGIAFVKQLESLGIVASGGSVTFDPSYAGMMQDATYRPQIVEQPLR
jgi:hypothetical protein